ncbi:phospholipase D [Coprinopsis marcescibilis]|uniref:Phospholipase n=1 Tax=Coprinopsis marcescibilis TaxID=230819 RepID=A0A5C3L4N0_COPMA|nr:phospholipase D [Coprinopsis marcescibilis]
MSRLAEVVHQAKAAAKRKIEDSAPTNLLEDDEYVSIAVEHDAEALEAHRFPNSQQAHDITEATTLKAPLRPGLIMSISGPLQSHSPGLDTPSARTGPPRSLSFAYAFPQSPLPRSSSVHPHNDEELAQSNYEWEPSQTSEYYDDPDEDLLFAPHASRPNSEFRTPLEYPQRELSHSSSGKERKEKGKRRSTEDSWFPRGLRWFHESPRDEKPPDTQGDYFGTPSLQASPAMITGTSTLNNSKANSVHSPTITDELPEKEHRDDEDIKDGHNVSKLRSPELLQISASTGSSTNEYMPSLPSSHQYRARATSQQVDQPLHSLETINYSGPAPHQTSHYRTVSVPSSPKSLSHKMLKRRWSFSSQHKPSSVAQTPNRQLSVDGSATASGTPGGARAKWGRLRSLLTGENGVGAPSPVPKSSSAVPPDVNIIDELITGGLCSQMMTLWFEKDEKGHRRVPVLLHRLRLRITDSLHPLHKTKTVFRIECEYANGAARWVVYRELKDFLRLHSQMKVINAIKGASSLGEDTERLPPFPKTSLPYFKFLNRDGGRISKADFAKHQREQIEDYLISLIRAVMFHPTANRLAAFLEISALSIALARSGGAQYKAGYLEVEAVPLVLPGGGRGGKGNAVASSSTTGFGRKSASRKERKEERWYCVRESYLVGLEQPGELAVWDVFLLDTSFEIQRVKRVYRQGLGLLHHEHHDSDDETPVPVTSPQVMTSGRSTAHHRRSGSGQTRTTTGTGTTDSSNARHHPPEGASSRRAQNGGVHVANGRLNVEPPSDDTKSGMSMSSIRSKVSKIFHFDGGHSSEHKPSVSGSSGPLSDRNPRAPTDESDDSDNESDTLSAQGQVTMLDPSININTLASPGGRSSSSRPNDGKGGGFNESGVTGDNFKPGDPVTKKQQEKALVDDKASSRHTFYIVNSQMRLKLYANTERHMLQFITALKRAGERSPYTKHNRFESFAPIRYNVSAQWLVDGRDYFWNLSRAILLAKECIYIHDWWLSPELYMRRPGMERYRLDRLLERKAKEGVKIYVILYLEVSNRTTPIDSNYTKQRLTSLHPNIVVQRAPSHFQTGTFYWAHHEKLCVIDQAIAFTGGLDLCFGRWDSPQHVMTDDALDTDRPEIWPGKDYSNPRMGDFYNLNKPEEDMYDRTKVARMPWHDVSLQIVGQPARDLARHFVQRWNYLLRIKNHSRIMPFLLPPPEFRYGELSELGLTGTCELQICRSAGPWSMGTPGKIEQSVQNAYLKAIQMSEHFVYIENQFFITSTVVNDVKIENNIGDAIVQRIIRAHRDQIPWKCCVMLPLLPGFTFPVDHSDASAIRIILECQNRTIARGPDSIFSRLRKEGIDPSQYISFFSIRNWAKMRGDILTTEQVYIHAKVLIVDDRLAIIGSANINERSQRGDRDSELAAVIRDTDMLDCSMAGRPFPVGRFAHSLRVRLMREHLGIDVDAVDEEDLMAREPVVREDEQEPWDPDHEQTLDTDDESISIKTHRQNKTPVGRMAHLGVAQVSQAAKGVGEVFSLHVGKGLKSTGVTPENPTVQDAGEQTLESERTDYNNRGEKRAGFASSAVPTMEEKTLAEGRPRKISISHRFPGHHIQEETIEEESPQEVVANENGNDADSDKTSEPHDFVLLDPPPRSRSRSTAHLDGHQRPSIDEKDEQNIFPEFRANLRKNHSIKSQWSVPVARPKVEFDDFEDPISDAFWKDKWMASAVHNTEIYRKVFHAIPDDTVSTWKQYKDFVAHHDRLSKPVPDTGDPMARAPSEEEPNNSDINSETSKEGHDESPPEMARDIPSSAATAESFKSRNRAKGSEPFEKWEREQMERLLNQLNGHLVIYPTRFLEGEDIANNFLFNADRLLPLPIYT